MSDMKIGTSTFGGYAKKERFDFKPNENNMYRVLPPLFSLADKGQYAKYYGTHKIWVQELPAPGSSEKGKSHVYEFICNEKIDQKTKLVQVHCAFCDTERQNKARYEDAKTKNASKEQLEEFRNKHVAPYEKTKKFYVNAVNLENKVGLLPLGIKQFKALQERLLDTQKLYSGLDATGVNGIFLNFKKNQRFKGDRDTTYQVDVAMDTAMVNGVPQMQLKPHVLTKDFIEVMRTTARDLGSLFKTITAEEIGHILQGVNQPAADRIVLLDKIFGRGERMNNGSRQVGGMPGVEVVQRMEIVNGDIKVHTPDPFAPGPMANPAAAPATTQVLVQNTPNLAPVQAPAQVTLTPAPAQTAQPAFPVNPMNPTVASQPGNMSDEDFVRMFGG